MALQQDLFSPNPLNLASGVALRSEGRWSCDDADDLVCALPPPHASCQWGMGQGGKPQGWVRCVGAGLSIPEERDSLNR